MRSTLLGLLILILTGPARAGLSEIQFQVDLDCSALPGAVGSARVQLANGATQQVPVPGLRSAQVFLTVTTHRIGVAYVTFTVKSSAPVQLLTPNQIVVVMGQSPSDFRFRAGGQEVSLRTRAFRVGMPGIPTMDPVGSPFDPNATMLLMPPGMQAVPGLQMPTSPTPGTPMDLRLPGVLPEGYQYTAPPGFVMPGQR